MDALAHVTAHRLMRYLDGQYPVLHGRSDQYGEPRYRNMQAVVSEYRDYLDMCARLGYGMKNSFVLYPKDLEAAQDGVQERMEAEKDALVRQEFENSMRAIREHPAFEADGLRIVLPESPDDLTAEGQALHHCVGTYANRVARRECIILFVRRCENPARPFFTVEVRERRAVQVQRIVPS